MVSQSVIVVGTTWLTLLALYFLSGMVDCDIIC